MDVQRDLRPMPMWRRYWPIGLVLLVVMGGWLTKRWLGEASYLIENSELRTAAVEAGPFRVSVRGTGLLKPKDFAWVATQVTGRVGVLHKRQGDLVQPGDVLLSLINPQLQRDAKRASWELDAARAEAKAAMAMLEAQLDDLRAAVGEAEMNYRSTRLRLDAETRLLERGGGAVSKLDYQRTKLEVEQQEQRWHSQQRRLDKMRANLQASREASDARLALLNNQLELAKTQVEQLQVRTGTAGIVQQLGLELGQQVAEGTGVALVADHASLIAELKVPELKVQEIRLGQAVLVDTRSSKIKGVVTRIDPAVVAGQVQVDVGLIDALPQEARPEMSIEAEIEIANLANTLFVQRPAFVQASSDAAVYRLSADGRFARRVQVQLGQFSVNQVQVLSGLQAGDRIIISDTAKWDTHQELLITKG